jgi:hypothetical protein
VPARLALTILFIAITTLAAEPVSFRAEIAPILQQRCIGCHGEEKAKGGYRLDTFAALSNPGDSGEPPFTAGDPSRSTLHTLLLESDDDARMPQKAAPLPQNETALIARWITEGAHFDGDDTAQSLSTLTRSRFLRPAPKTYPRPLPVTALAYSGDGTALAVGGYHELLIFHPEKNDPPRRIGGLPERITALAWSPKKNLIAAVGGTPGRWGTVAIIDAADRFKTRILCDVPEQVLSVAISHDGTLLAAGCGDRTLRIFELPTGTQRHILRPHADWLQSIAFHPRSHLLVTASRDRTARLIDATTGEVQTTYRGHDSPLLAAAFSDDGSHIYTTARTGPVHIWAPQTAAKTNTFTDFTGTLENLTTTPAGTIAASTDGTIHLFQTAQKSPYLTLPGHHGPITAVAAAPGGYTFATGSAHGIVQIWNTACPTPTQTFRAAP